MGTPETASSADGEFKDLFTPEFKRLKARKPPPDLSDVIDLTTYGTNCGLTEIIKPYPVSRTSLNPVVGLKPCHEWKAYRFTDCPGFIVVLNPFVQGYQRYWVSQCLATYPSDEANVTNLSALGEDSRCLWKDFADKNMQQLDKNEPLRKLRWTTLGYHYNWTTKEYTESQRAEFPLDVSCLSHYIGACLGFEHFNSEAAIVNYYHLDSTLAGHTDHSELDHSAPLLSISFGQTAIFLIGGCTKATKPKALYLRSGDVCIMSGLCRLSYHAVPKILPPLTDADPLPVCFDFPSKNSSELNNCKPVAEHVDSRTTQCRSSSAKVGDACLQEEGTLLIQNGLCVKNTCQAEEISTEKNAYCSSLPENVSRITEALHNDNNRTTQSLSAPSLGDGASSTQSNHNGSDLCVPSLRQPSIDTSFSVNSFDQPSSLKRKQYCSSEERTTGAVKDTKQSKCALPDTTKSFLDERNAIVKCGFHARDSKHVVPNYSESIDVVNAGIMKTLTRLDFSPFESYLKASRINLNIRQVLPSGQSLIS